ncbi:MAG: phosphopantothenoylcysteine decarboxylase, partial [Sciscionella sp.]
VETTEEMYDAVRTHADASDVIVMAAAPADFRPRHRADHKLKKTADHSVSPLDLVETPDILAALVADRRAGQVLIGFAAETGDADGGVLDHARAKLARKGCDLLVVNDVSGGAVFGSDRTGAVILGADDSSIEVPTGPKALLAEAIWDVVATRWLS